MDEWLLRTVNNGDAIAAYAALSIFVLTWSICGFRRQWPSTSGILIVLLAAYTTCAAVRLSLLLLILPAARLGQLSEDRVLLLIGTLALTGLAAKETYTAIKRAVGPALS